MNYDRIVFWVKNSQNNQWFNFLRLNLNANYFTNKVGVYVIWYTAPTQAKVIRVGQGSIGERLREHRNNPEIVKYSKLGQLKVTWAVVDNILLFSTDLNGIEAYLADLYKPLEGERFPLVTQISVNPIE